MVYYPIGVNVTDHDLTLRSLTEVLQNNVTPYVISLQAKECPGKTSALTTMMRCCTPSPPVCLPLSLSFSICGNSVAPHFWRDEVFSASQSNFDFCKSLGHFCLVYFAPTPTISASLSVIVQALPKVCC